MEKMAHRFSFKTPKKVGLKPEWFPIFVILLLGFFLRFYRVRDYIVFLGDEGRDALVVYNILHGDLTLLGPTSSVGGFFLGPIYYYLMTPFMFLSRYDPIGPAIMVVLFGVATIFLVYKMGREFFNPLAGIIAAFLYAISPVVVTYSRSSWNPNVFPFFTISTLYVLYKAVVENKISLFILTGFLMGLNLQIHYLATFVGAIVFFYTLVAEFELKISYIKTLAKRYLSLLLGFLIGFSPFLLFEIRHQFTNSKNILEFIFNSPETGASGQILVNVQHVFVRLFGGLVLSYPDFPKFHKFDPNILQIWLVVSAFLGLVSVIFFLILFVKARSEKSELKKFLLIFIWALLGIGLFGLYKKSIYDYYLGFIFPVPFLLVGLLLSEVIIILKKPGKIIVVAILVCLFLINLKFNPIAVPGNNQVLQVKEIADFVLSKTDGKPYNFSISGIGNSDHAYRYFFKLAGKDPVTILGIDQDPGRKSVTDQLLVVCETNPCAPLGESRQEIAGFGRAEIAGVWDVSVLKVYKLVHYTGQ